MANYWEVRPLNEFDAYDVGEGSSNGRHELRSAILAHVSKTGHLDEHFRPVVRGADPIVADFNGSAVTSLAAFTAYRFHMEQHPADVKVKINTFSTKWEDLDALVAADRMRVQLANNTEAKEHFRLAVEAAKAADAPLSVAVRWSIQASGAYGLKLVLQAMPASARELRRDARRTADDAAAIALATWSAPADMMTKLVSGPKPVLFARDPPQALAALAEHPANAKPGEIKTVNKIYYLRPVHVPIRKLR